MGLAFQKRYSRHQSLQGILKIHHFWFLIVIYQINSQFILLADQIQYIILAYKLLSLFYQLHLKNVFHANHFHLNLHRVFFIVKVDLHSILFFQELSKKTPDFFCHQSNFFPQFQKLIVNLL